MKIFYWAPWIGKVGTIKAVTNSADILEKYSKKNIQTKIIDAVGEWSKYELWRPCMLKKIYPSFFIFLGV